MFGLLCGIAILFIITCAVLSFDIFSNISNSSTYNSTNSAKTAHTYFLAAFVIISITLVIFIIGISIAGFEKIHHKSKDDTKLSRTDFMAEIKKYMKEIRSGKKSDYKIEKYELDKDVRIIQSYSKEDKRFTILLFIVGLLSLVTLVLTSIGQYYLGVAKSASASTNSNVPDPFLSKASTEGWFAIALSLVSFCIVLAIVGTKIKMYSNEKKLVSSAEKVLSKG